jgi:dimethylamine/trimethylamine dehydrogenase
MVSQVKRGVLDFIGAARPSIADPFLPKKVEEGRMGDIRECIGCNICAAADNTYTPIRCTQNPTMGEEWRRGWHPEYIPPKESEDQILVVGAGPAGLECAMALGKRGYDVMLAEASQELGGRAAREPRLPGLTVWGRVREYRMEQLNQLPNVQVFLDSKLSAQDVMDTGANRIVIATGSKWRRDGTARYHRTPIAALDQSNIFTPDDVMDGVKISGPVIVYDDDHYYMGGVIAEKLRLDGLDVTLVTPASIASAWTVNTLEQSRIQRRLIELGVKIYANEALTGFSGGQAIMSCVYTGSTRNLAAQSVVMVTARQQNDGLFYDLVSRRDEWDEVGIKSVDRVGDALGPGTIAAAVFGGHRYARELDCEPVGDDVPFMRENAQLSVWTRKAD